MDYLFTKKHAAIDGVEDAFISWLGHQFSPDINCSVWVNIVEACIPYKLGTSSGFIQLKSKQQALIPISKHLPFQQLDDDTFTCTISVAVISRCYVEILF